MAVNGGHAGTKKGPNWGHVKLLHRSIFSTAGSFGYISWELTEGGGNVGGSVNPMFGTTSRFPSPFCCRPLSPLAFSP